MRAAWQYKNKFAKTFDTTHFLVTRCNQISQRPHAVRNGTKTLAGTS